MNKVVIAVAAVALLGASAQLSFAQANPPGNAGGPAQADQAPPPRNGNVDWRDQAIENGPPGPGHAGPPPPPHRPPPPPAAAHFLFQRGRSRIAISCPQAEPLQGCVRAAMELMDKIASMHAAEHRARAYQPPNDDVQDNND